MADNATTPVPDGKTFAFDECVINSLAVLVALTKLGYGADGTFQYVDDNTPLPTKAYASADQDPIFNEADATKTAVGAATATFLTPPAGCKYARVVSTTDCFIRTDGNNAADAAGATPIFANQPEVIPVVAGVGCNVIQSSAGGTIYATPMKVR